MVPSDLMATSHNLRPDITPDPRPNTNISIRNFSKKPLTEAQEQVLAHGPNFAVVSKQPPIGEYVAVVEKVCQQLKQREAEELRSEIKSILKNIQPPDQTSPKKRPWHLGNWRMITSEWSWLWDKGVSMVVMDRKTISRSQKNYWASQHTKPYPQILQSSTKISWFHCLKPSKQKVG